MDPYSWRRFSTSIRRPLDLVKSQLRPLFYTDSQSASSASSRSTSWDLLQDYSFASRFPSRIVRHSHLHIWISPRVIAILHEIVGLGCDLAKCGSPIFHDQEDRGIMDFTAQPKFGIMKSRQIQDNALSTLVKRWKATWIYCRITPGFEIQMWRRNGIVAPHLMK